MDITGGEPTMNPNIEYFIKEAAKTCALCYSCTAGYGSSCGGNLSH